MDVVAPSLHHSLVLRQNAQLPTLLTKPDQGKLSHLCVYTSNLVVPTSVERLNHGEMAAEGPQGGTLPPLIGSALRI